MPGGKTTSTSHTGSQCNRHSKQHFGFLCSDLYHVSCFIFLLGFLSSSLVAAFEQLFHNCMKRSRYFGQGASPRCLCRTGGSLSVWKSVAEVFPLVSDPLFKGMIDTRKLILKMFLNRASSLQLCEGICALPVCLVLQWYVFVMVLV